MTSIPWKIFILWLSLWMGSLIGSVESEASENVLSAQALWKETKQAFHSEDWTRAITNAEELIRRHSASTHYTEAHFLLGVAHWQKGTPQLGIGPLKYFTEAIRHPDLKLQSKMILAQIYEEEGQPQLAYLLSREILHSENQKTSDRRLQVQALITQGKAQVELGRDTYAAQTLTTVKDMLQKMSQTGYFDPTLSSQSAGLGVRLKLKECTRLGSATRPLEEGQVIDQIARRGDCLLDAFNQLQQTFAAENGYWAKRASQEFTLGVRQYQVVCGHPPRSKLPRTALENARYRAELVHVLRQECRGKLQRIQDVLKLWKQTLFISSSPQLKQLEQTLQF